MGKLSGKVAIITGASSGIGAATAVLFSRLGAELCLSGRNLENLEKTAKKCEEATNKRPFLVLAELCDESAAERLVSETIKKFGRLDILINNAGIQKIGSIETMSLEQYDSVMSINVRSLLHLTKLATPHLIKTKGNIVNVSSVNGLRSFAGVLAYSISKASVDQITRCVALELAPKQVRVNCVNPGVVITELQKRAGLNEDQYAAYLVRAKETHALGRPGDPDEVASAIAFLASDESSFTTGTTLPIDGGRQAMCPR